MLSFGLGKKSCVTLGKPLTLSGLCHPIWTVNVGSAFRGNSCPFSLGDLIPPLLSKCLRQNLPLGAG